MSASSPSWSSPSRRPSPTYLRALGPVETGANLEATPRFTNEKMRQPMASLLVRHPHSRFQLRRGTGFTTTLGLVMGVLSGVCLLATLVTAASSPSAVLCPATLALLLGFSGL